MDHWDKGKRHVRFILAMRLKYFSQVAMFSSLDSSERSSMCELHISLGLLGTVFADFCQLMRLTYENRGTPCSLK